MRYALNFVKTIDSKGGWREREGFETGPISATLRINQITAKVRN